jgi:hypothetical protein
MRGELNEVIKRTILWENGFSTQLPESAKALGQRQGKD